MKPRGDGGIASDVNVVVLKDLHVGIAEICCRLLKSCPNYEALVDFNCMDSERYGIVCIDVI